MERNRESLEAHHWKPIIAIDRVGWHSEVWEFGRLVKAYPPYGRRNLVAWKRFKNQQGGFVVSAVASF